MTPQELVTLRNAAGMTQQQLADALGWNRRTIYRMERGETDIVIAKDLAIRAVLIGRSLAVAKPAARRSKASK